MTEEFPRLRNESQEKRDVEAKERGERTGVLYHSVRPFHPHDNGLYEIISRILCGVGHVSRDLWLDCCPLGHREGTVFNGSYCKHHAPRSDFKPNICRQATNIHSLCALI